MKANYEAGLIDLDGYMGKVGALSMSTGKHKYNADNEDGDDKKKKRKNPPSLDNSIRRPPASQQGSLDEEEDLLRMLVTGMFLPPQLLL